MKKKILGMAIAIGFIMGSIGVAAAQGGKFNEEKMEERMEKRLERMDEKLDLSESQETQIRAILESKKDKFKALRSNEDLSREERRAESKALRQGIKAEIAAVLTDDQKVLAEEMQRDRKHKRRGKGKKGMKRMLKDLDLSEAQEVGVKTILQNAKVERETIKEANNGDRKAARPELKAHRQATAEKIRQLLNPEQREKFDAKREEIREKHKRRGKGKGNGQGRGQDKG